MVEERHGRDLGPAKQYDERIVKGYCRDRGKCKNGNEQPGGGLGGRNYVGRRL